MNRPPQPFSAQPQQQYRQQHHNNVSNPTMMMSGAQGQQRYAPPNLQQQQTQMMKAPGIQGGNRPPFAGPMMNGIPPATQNGNVSPQNSLISTQQQMMSPMGGMTQQMSGMQIKPPSSAFSPYRGPGPQASHRHTGPSTNRPPQSMQPAPQSGSYGQLPNQPRPTGFPPQVNQPRPTGFPPQPNQPRLPTGFPPQPNQPASLPPGPLSGFSSGSPSGPPSLSGPSSLSGPMGSGLPPLTRPPGPGAAPMGGPRKPTYPQSNLQQVRAPQSNQPGFHPPPGMPHQGSSMAGPPTSGQIMPGNVPMGQPRMAQMTQPMGAPHNMGVGPMSRQPQPMGAPGMPGPMSSPQQKRIDPNQMPNPIQVMNDDQASFDGEVFTTNTRGKVPPLVSTKCRIQDDGNCSPRYMRSSVYAIPCNQDMLKESGVPMAIVTTPFARIPADEHQLRYVDHGPSGPVRCNRCKTYMNPFMQFIDGGRRFVCNICSHSSEVPQEYFCHLDHQGRRVDMYERPELCFGSYEFIATTDYCKDSKMPEPPAFIFMIDVSYQSVQQGMVKILANELHTLLDNLPKDVGMEESLLKVGFVTYSTQLHFYNVKANLAQPQMLVVTDLEDAFVPLLDGFLVNYKEAKVVVDSLLDMLPEMFKDTRETDVVLGPVVAAGLEALKCAGISGKLFIFHSSLPIAEAPGKLKNREDRKLLATDKEKTILMPQGNHYMNLAKECVNNGVSIDLFLFPNSYVDVATVGLMVTQTGGQIYRYSYFKESTHGEQFVRDLRKNFSRELGFDAIMRLRCSTGLRPVEFFGSFVMNNTTDVELASIDSDKAIAIEIKHDDKIPEDGVAFVQNALLYTSVSGQRRLRIHNLAFATCSQLADLYRCCELDTTVNYLSKYALRQVLFSSPQAIKDSLIQKCVQILACYRQHCATPSTSGQLILPECMKLLPLYVNCLIKSDVLAGGSEMSSDDRAFLMQACLSMPPAVSSSYFYPRVLALHTVDTEHEENLLPDQLRCLGEKFEDNGVYLLENTISMFIWVGLQVDPRYLSDVFGVSGIGQLDIEMTQFPVLDTPLSNRIRQIIEQIQSQRQRYLKLTVVRQRDKLEPWFKHYIVEDKGFHAIHLSYVDFLCHVHKEIRNLLN